MGICPWGKCPGVHVRGGYVLEPRFSQHFTVYSLPHTNFSLCECPLVYISIQNFLKLYVHDIGCVSLTDVQMH